MAERGVSELCNARNALMSEELKSNPVGVPFARRELNNQLNPSDYQK